MRKQDTVGTDDDKAEARRLRAEQVALYIFGGGEPAVKITDWGFVRFPDSPRKGVNLAGSDRGHERLSSTVVRFNADNMTAMTASGRIYFLSGEPDPDYAMWAARSFAILESLPCELVPMDAALAEVARWKLLIEDAEVEDA